MRNILNIYDLSFQELSELLASWGESPYRSTQVWEGLYRHLWSSPLEFTNLSKSLRLKLEEYSPPALQQVDNLYSFSSLTPIRSIESKDGETIKTLFSLDDQRRVEAVLMRYSNRRTLCISTQAGCVMGCVFCATGQMGFQRHLTSGEIIEQVLHFARELNKVGEQVTNIVVMGMGEPFHNYDFTLAAITRLNDSKGFNLGARRFTISTVGIVPGIRRFAQEHSQVNLAISLHAADDALRSELLPINKKYPLQELFAACLEYVHETHRRLSFEWALIDGVNDTPEQAKMLAQRLQSFRLHGSILCHVNVILLNPTKKFSGSASTHQAALNFQNLLKDAGIPCTIRLRRGIEIKAGCGQLANQ